MNIDYPEYQYAHLQPLNHSDVVKAFPEWSAELADQAWRKWLDYYLTKARICYQSQLHNHYEIVWTHFCKTHGLSVDVPIDDYDDDGETAALWSRAQRQSGYAKHEDDYAEMRFDLAVYGRNLNPTNEIRWVTFDDMMAEYRAMLEAVSSGRPHPTLLIRHVMEVWFNSVTYNAPDEIKRLRKLAYPEYLKTLHWTRVKTAMRIAHGAKCQGDQCQGGDSYWRDESRIHVHHMTYANKGNERYNDLRLLCENCHALVHKFGVQMVFARPEANL